jgi:glycosyltransferase involved in cell wall biosynthesis
MSSPTSLRVIFLTSSYPRSPDDNASIFIRHLAEHIRDLGHDVHVIAPADTEAGIAVEHGITVERFKYLPARWQRLAYGSGILSNLRNRPLLWLQVPPFAIAMAWSLMRSLRRTPRPRLLHAHWVIPQGLIAALIGTMLGVPVIVSLHGADAFALHRGPLSFLKRLCLRRCAAWTANTHATADAVIQGHAMPPPCIIPMGVDTDRFGSGCRDRLRTGLGPSELIILYVGRLVEKKGIDDLIQAFACLAGDLREKAHLWIVGRGELENPLTKLSVDLGVGDRVKFWGEIPNNLLPDYYAAADLFVGPSVEAAFGDTEGQGVVFIEAFAAGVCVVATSVGGIPDVVNDGHSGVLVPPRNPAALAAAMQRLLIDSGLRQSLARNARAKVRQSYDWSKVADQFAGLYRDILENDPG